MTTVSEPCVGGEVTRDCFCGVLNDTIVGAEGDSTKNAQWQNHHLVWLGVFFIDIFGLFYFLMRFSLICLSHMRYMIRADHPQAPPRGFPVFLAITLSCGLFNLII